MMNETEISLYQIKVMKHAIGFSRDKVKRGKYIAWRNYFCSYEPSEPWERLVSLGLAEKSIRERAIYYFVTDEGLKMLSSVLEIQIIEDKE